jgi:hypothetical protein
VLRRSASTGALTPVQCLTSTPTAGCDQARGLDGIVGVTVAPDGDHLYTAGSLASAIGVFRVAGDGTLSQPARAAGCVSQGGAGGCSPARGLTSVVDVRVTPDARSLYAVSEGSQAIAYFSLDAGGLPIQPAGPSGCRSFLDVEGCAVDPDFAGVDQLETMGNRRLVVGSESTSTIVVLTRNARSGDLTQTACTSAKGLDGCDWAPDLLNLTDVAVGGGSIFVAGNATDTVVSLGEVGDHASHDEYGVVGCTQEPPNVDCVPARVGGDPAALAVKAGRLYVVSAGARGVEAFDVTADGDLHSRAGRHNCLVGAAAPVVVGCEAGHVPADPNVAAISPDGRNLYVAGPSGVAAVKRDTSAPTCRHARVVTGKHAPTLVRFDCRDIDGDVLHYRVVEAPDHARLGRIDQHAGTVRLIPNTGFTGTSRLTFAASASGVESQYSVLVRVAACPGAEDAAGRHLLGTSGSDVLSGGPRRDVLCGLGGADRISGRGAGDLLLGGAGPDTLRGGPARDRCRGGSGRDRVHSCERR